jgi:hypothetical protein
MPLTAAAIITAHQHLYKAMGSAPKHKMAALKLCRVKQKKPKPAIVLRTRYLHRGMPAY